MGTLQELLEISSPAIVTGAHTDNITDPALKSLLSTRNGFYALENALWVFASASTESTPGHDHPEIASWARQYPKTGGVGQAFAVDALGYPFFMSNQGVLRMDLETGNFVRAANDLESWAANLLVNYDQMTGWRVCHDWQDANGQLSPGHRLFPKTPFVGGGKEEVGNLASAPLTELVGFYAELADQIHNMPEGGSIEIRMLE